MRYRRLSLARTYARRVRAQSPTQTLAKLAHPRVLQLHVGRLLRGRLDDASNPYERSDSEAAEVIFCSELLAMAEAEVASHYHELDGSAFERELSERYSQVRLTEFNLGRFRMWWTFVRILRPNLVVETGVHDGLSTAIVLLAMEANGVGRLISIDLPATDLPPDVDGPGWLVPERLRDRWDFRVGDAKILLPQVTAVEGSIDIFIHDSEHEQEHQRFEFATVAGQMSRGGLLLSDQDYPHEKALQSVAVRLVGRHARVKSTVGDPGGFVGGVRLPDRPGAPSS